MLLTGELTKLGIVFNSEKEHLKFFSCYNYNYYYYCFIYHYHYYYLTLISTVNFLHLEDQDLFSFIYLFIYFFEHLEYLLMSFYVIFLHVCIIFIIVIRTVISFSLFFCYYYLTLICSRSVL